MIYLVRYGEIGLKGLNRPFFEKKLIENIRQISGQKLQIKKTRGRIIVESERDISGSLKRVFGIVNFSIAERVSFDNLNEKILGLVKEKQFKTFRITINRINKNFSRTSNELAREIGAVIAEKLNKKVDLENYDLNIQIEIADRAYVFFDKIGCAGGLPVSTEGKVIVLIETEKGIEAAKKMMKRGCDVIPVSFADFDISGINDYLPHKKTLTKIKNLREIEKIAKENDARALVVEDTFDNLKEYGADLCILRPLAFE